MYLNPLSLGKWTARSWAIKAEDGTNKSQEVEVRSRETRRFI